MKMQTVYDLFDCSSKTCADIERERPLSLSDVRIANDEQAVTWRKYKRIWTRCYYRIKGARTCPFCIVPYGGHKLNCPRRSGSVSAVSRVGELPNRLADKTMARIRYGLDKYGREIASGAVRWDEVDLMIDQHATVVEAHDGADMTFTVSWRPGIIYQPDNEFMTWLLGATLKSTADDEE